MSWNKQKYSKIKGITSPNMNNFLENKSTSFTRTRRILGYEKFNTLWYDNM